MREIGWIGRREAMRLLGVGGAALAAGLPDRVHAATAKNTLVLGLDISDTISLDPAREAQYTPPLTVTAAYESLVTMTPGDYLNVKPALATAWARTPDGKGWRFTLREGAKFNSGNPVTVEDVKWTLDRVMQRQGSAVAIPGRDRPGRDRRSANDRCHHEASRGADADRAVRSDQRHPGTQGGGGAWRHRRPPTPTPRTRRPTG